MSSEEITQSELIHLSMVKEFTQTFGSHQASALTHLPIQSFCQSVVTGNLSPLTRRLMTMIVLECPFVEVHGIDYVETLDRLLEKVYVELLQNFILATQFDVLACQSHIYSLVIHLYKQIPSTNGIHSSSSITPAGLEPWCERVRKSRAFDIRGNVVSQTLGHESVAINRQEKFVAVAHSIQSLFSSIESLQSDSVNFWDVVKQCPTLEGLPINYSHTFDSILRTIAHCLDVILDHQDRRENLKRILDKIPASFIVFSLQWIDPTPLVEQVIGLFVWKPPGIHSLLQKVGGLVCRDSETRQRLQDLRVGDTFALEILDDLLEKTKEFKNSKARLDQIISRYEGSIDEDVLNYLKIAIRDNEKSTFVDFLASPTVIELIKHIGHIYPLIIQQISKVIITLLTLE